MTATRAHTALAALGLTLATTAAGAQTAIATGGSTGFYNDNPGSMSGTVALAVPEPGALVLFMAGLLSLALMLRRRGTDAGR